MNAASRNFRLRNVLCDMRPVGRKMLPKRICLRCLRRKLSACLVLQFERGPRILRVIHGRDARATSANCTSTAHFGFITVNRKLQLALQKSKGFSFPKPFITEQKGIYGYPFTRLTFESKLSLN